MKAKMLTLLCVVALTLASTPCLAQGDDVDPGAVAVDAVIVRPCCLVATVVGSAFFVLSLPFALPSKSVRRSAHALVVQPARATFTRPMGDFDAMVPY